MPVLTRSQAQAGPSSSKSHTIITVDIHCLVPMTLSQRESFTHAVTTSSTSNTSRELFSPTFIPWPHPSRDGTPADLLTIYKRQMQQSPKPGLDFLFFIDRQCLQHTPPAFIVAQSDHYTLLYSESALSLFNSYLAQHPVSGIAEIHEGHLETLEDEALMRALSYGRLPAKELGSVYGNLEIANMDMSELVEYCGGEAVEARAEGLGVVEVVEDPEWDMERFMRRLEGAILAETEEEEE